MPAISDDAPTIPTLRRPISLNAGKAVIQGRWIVHKRTGEFKEIGDEAPILFEYRELKDGEVPHGNLP